MSIIKKKDIYEGGNPVKELTKNLEDLLVVEKKLIKQNKDLSASLQQVKKSNDGTEAKKLISATDRLSKSTVKLKEVKTASVRVNEQILKANVKLAQSRTKEAKQLALVRQKTLQTNKALREQAKATLGVTKRFGALSRQLVGALGITAGFSALAGIVKNAGKIFVTFEKSSSKLAAILGKTKDQIKGLTDQAKQLGATTAFTASEIIGLQTELAKRGFTQQQIEASTQGILNLAAATGQDLAQSAELAGSTLRIFNLDASEMSRVSDVLAKSTTISSLSMEKLATILPTVGKTAQIAGVSLEKTAALAGTLTDRGLDASSAATSLRNIFLELSKKGLTWNEAMAKINASTDKNKTSLDLFGKRAAAAGVILSETAGSTDELTTALENSNGAAQEMADTMLDNLAGDMTIAQSAWEGFILSLEDGEGVISRVLRGATQLFTSLLEGLTNFNNGVVRLSALEQERLGITDEITAAVKRQREQLEAITDKEEQRTRASAQYQKLRLRLSELEKEALRASIDGETKAAAAAQIKIDYTLALIEGTKAYIPELRAKNVETEKDIVLTTSSTKATNDNTAALTEQKKSLRSQLNLLAARDKLIAQDKDTPGDLDLGNIEEGLDLQAQLNDNYRAIELEKIQEQEDAKKAIRDVAIQETAQFASDIFNQGQDSKLARINSDIEAEKKIAQDQLDKGLINEIQFNAKIAELNKKSRNAEAKAEKKKALFSIAINTAIGVVKALPNYILAAVVAATGVIQAAFVAARPLPSFEKGGLIGGKRHKDGGTVIEAEKGEFMLNRQGYQNAPETAEMINKGLFRDADVNRQVTKNPLSSKLDRLNKTNALMLTALLNGVGEYTSGDKTYTQFANGDVKTRYNG